jgi:hypothetical protein
MVVGVELEEEVGEVNNDEDNGGTTAELEEIGGFKIASESIIQPLVLSETSGLQELRGNVK